MYRLRVELAVDEFLPQLPQCLYMRNFDELKVADTGEQRQRIRRSSTTGHFRLVLRAYRVTVARGVRNNLHFPARAPRLRLLKIEQLGNANMHRVSKRS